MPTLAAPTMTRKAPPSKKSSLTKRQPRRSTTTQTFKKPQHKVFARKSDESLERFSGVILRVVHAKLPESAFTRDDVLGLVSRMRLDSREIWAKDAAGVNDTATGTRYRKVCDAVQHLLKTHQLSSLDWLRLCLPEVHEKLANEAPLHIAYVPTIRRLVQENYQTGTRLDAMAIVDRWKSDQHLPENVKRMTVRAVMPFLVREKLLKRGSYKTEFLVA